MLKKRDTVTLTWVLSLILLNLHLSLTFFPLLHIFFLQIEQLAEKQEELSEKNEKYELQNQRLQMELKQAKNKSGLLEQQNEQLNERQENDDDSIKKQQQQQYFTLSKLVYKCRAYNQSKFSNFLRKKIVCISVFIVIFYCIHMSTNIPSVGSVIFLT